jgi:integrase
MNNPPAVLFDQFLKERRFLRNVTDKTLTWYGIAYRNYCKVVPGDDLPSKASLQALVIALRERGIRPITVNTYVAAMNAFCAWLHQEGHLAGPVKLQKLRVEKRVLTLLDDTQMRADPVSAEDVSSGPDAFCRMPDPRHWSADFRSPASTP